MSDENAAGTSKENAEPTGGPQSSAQRSGPDQDAQEAGGATPARAGESEQAVDPLGSETSPEGGTRQAPSRARRGMFNVRGSGDTSGFGGLRLPGYAPAPAERPYGGWFDEFVDELGAALAERGVGGAVEQVTVDRGEMTLYVDRDRVLDLCRTLRDDPALRFELCSAVSGVDYGEDVAQQLHVVDQLLSMTYRRRLRLEVALDVDDAHVPASSRSTRRPTGTSARPGTCSASSSTATRPDPDPHAGRLGRPPAAQELPARRHPRGVQGRADPAARPAEGLHMTRRSAT